MALPYQNILEAIGNTPLVRLNRLVGPQHAEVYLKLEHCNAGGSVKDRIALSMVNDAEHRGVLRPGMTIVELSSSNTAVGLAIVVAVRGYHLVAVCDRYLATTKCFRLRACAPDIAFLPLTPKGMETAELRIEISKRLGSRIGGTVALLHNDNTANRETHYRK